MENIIKNITLFKNIVLLTIFRYIIVIFSLILVINEYGLSINKNLLIFISEIILFLICYNSLKQNFEKERLIEDEKKENINKLYKNLLILYIMLIILTFEQTYVFDKVLNLLIYFINYIQNQINCNFGHIDSVKKYINGVQNQINYNFEIEEISEVMSKEILPIKSAIEVAIIRDVIYQSKGWNLKNTRISYWRDLIGMNSVYIHPYDKLNKRLRLWVIRGDECENRIDYMSDIGIKKGRKYYLKLEDKERSEIINEIIERKHRYEKSEDETDNSNMISIDEEFLIEDETDNFDMISIDGDVLIEDETDIFNMISIDEQCLIEYEKNVLMKNMHLLQVLPESVTVYKKKTILDYVKLCIINIKKIVNILKKRFCNTKKRINDKSN